MDFIRPKRLPEANIQAAIYKRLVDENIECYLEYRIKEFKLRADLIVVKNSKIICACEIKSYKTLKNTNTNTKQFKKYFKLGIPIFYCSRLEQVNLVTDKILNLYNSIVL